MDEASTKRLLCFFFKRKIFFVVCEIIRLILLQTNEVEEDNDANLINILLRMKN